MVVTLSLGAVCASNCQTSDLDNTLGAYRDNIQSEPSDDILMDEVQPLTIDDVKLTSSNEEIGETEERSLEDNIVGESETHYLGESDNVNVYVQNVFKGQKASIYVTVPKATGTVNVTIGEKTYAPEFVSGVATLILSEYNIGLNNVTVKYNDIVKETSFKVLDGVITNETFSDYYELIEGIYNNGGPLKQYKMFGYIPKGAVLDFRGLINITNVDYAYTYVSGLNIISSTKDAIIDGNIRFSELGCNINNINITGNLIIYSNTVLANSNIGSLRLSGNNLANIIMDNVTVKGNTTISVFGRGHDVSICNSNLFGAIAFDQLSKLTNFNVKNCSICGSITTRNVDGGIIENCVVEGYLNLKANNFIIRNNIINTVGSNYAIIVNSANYEGYCSVIVNNTIYNYGHDYAVIIPGYSTVANNTLFSNNFGNDAVKTSYIYRVGIENNTPNQISVLVENTKNVLYDENVAICVNVNASGNVTVDVNGKKYNSKLLDGSAELIINEYLPGNNVINVYYVDDINDVYGFAKSTFYVEKVDVCPVELNYTNMMAGKNTPVNVILPNDANGAIEVRIYNATHNIKIIQNASGSENIITIPSLVEGNYFMNVTFISDKYVTNSSCVNISFIHEPVYQLTASNVVMDYNDGSKYNVLVTKDGKYVGAGEIVNITFNGVTNGVETDENGYATLALDGAPKTYAIMAEYNGVTKSNKVTIKNILKASNISKKKAKQIKFSATLKTSKGKAIVGKKITFKFKGKTYSAKTNKKGVATITLKNLKVGKYTITSKYGACTVKNTIKIKK